jgi:site-specific recombinase XerD
LIETYNFQEIRSIENFRKQAAQAFFTRSKEAIRPASVNRELSLLKHMYSKAIECGKVKESPLNPPQMEEAPEVVPLKASKLLAGGQGFEP